MADDNNNAKFGVEIPPVKGGAEAAKVFDDLAKSAKRAADVIGGVGGSGGSVAKTTDEFGRMRNAASTLLAQMGPLGAQAAVLQSRFGAVASSVGAFRGAAAGLVIGLGAAVGILLAVAAAVKGLTTAFHTLADAVKRAGEEQRINATFRNFVGNAKLAEEQLVKLADAANNRGRGLFDDEEYVKTATLFKSLGAGTQNLTIYTEDLAKATAFAHSTLEEMGNAYQMVLMGRIRNPTIEQKTLILALADAQKKFGETSEQAYQRMIPLLRAQKISAAELATALVKAGSEGGRFANSITENLNEYEGALRSVRNRWDNFLEALGKPILDKLTPLLLQWADYLAKITEKAPAWGEAIAGIVEKVSGVLTPLVSQWQTLFETIEKISRLRITVGPLGNPQFSFEESAAGAAADVGKKVAPEPTRGGSGLMSSMDQWLKFREETAKTVDEFESDTKVMKDFWTDYVQIQSTATTATERHRREMELLGKTIENLKDPLAHAKELLSGLTPDEKLITAWRIYYADRAAKEKELEERMKYGMASVSDSIIAGIHKLQDQWGTMQTQISQAIVDIGNSLATNISSGLADILDGTKSISQGFKDMALAIVKSIEQIIIKMLVQIALMQVLNALSGGTGYFTLGGSQVSVAALAGLGRQQGGMIPGRGDRDSVHAMLTPGEFVINKESARKIGYDKLERLNRFAAGGMVSAARRAYGQYNPDWETEYPGSGWEEPGILGEPFYGKPSTIAEGGGGYREYVDNPIANRWLNMIGGLSGFGTSPSFGISLFGPTAIPTFWVNYPGVGNVPLAVPAGGWTPDVGQKNIGTSRHTPPPTTKAGGGLVSSYPVSSWTSYASGAMVANRGMSGGGGAVVNTVTNQSATSVRVEINNFPGSAPQVRSEANGGGLTDADAREIGRMVNAMVDARVTRAKHVGGELYISHSARGG